MPHRVRETPIIALTPAADYSALAGRLVSVSGDTCELLDNALTPAHGILLDGGTGTDGHATVAILGPPFGTVRVKASGTITKGDRIQQGADGTVVTDAGSGARVIVGVALENAVSGDLFEAALHQPISLS